LRTLEQDALPSLGHRTIAEITSSELLATVSAIEQGTSNVMDTAVKAKVDAMWNEPGLLW